MFQFFTGSLLGGLASAASSLFSGGGGGGSIGSTLLSTLGSVIGGERANDQNSAIASANNAFNADQSQVTRDFNAQQAALNREWQENMANSTYRRAMHDMHEAGLNPMLAYSQGGAPTGSGSAASASAASSSGNPTMRDTISPAINTALQVAQVESSLAVQRAQVDKIRAEERNVDADTAIKRVHVGESGSKGLIEWQIDKLAAEIHNIKQSTKTETERTGLTAAQAALSRIDQLLRRGQIDETAAHTALLKVKTMLDELDVPRAENASEAENSWWKKEVSPYLKDFSNMSHSAAAAAGFAAGGLGLRRPRGGLTINNYPRR